MKNLFIYYIAIFAPMVLMIGLSKTDLVGPQLCVELFFFYFLVYRTVIDGIRLSTKNVIPKKDIWKMIIRGYHFKYFRELYLK
ncbi:hypothetical protein [Roseivirga echinicomitans]|uniref:Uncharacterized protein n=1 Tax=Roseivirga echinicomitans TaxID=296218 RepID=A0A150X2Q6_9BACT|nr:hypothetical protein [Roseivirga echinicomitans]KYG72993.1 hypothetical protein AWN68_09870 [Roseivirga echinicomitans]